MLNYKKGRELSLAVDEDKKARAVLRSHEVNFVGAELEEPGIKI